MTTDHHQEAPISEPRRCSIVSRTAGDDPGGSGTPFGAYLGIEVPPPWDEDVTESPGFPEGLSEPVEKAFDIGVIGKFTGLMPDPDYSREGYSRALLYRRSARPGVAYERSEWLLPEGKLAPFVRALSDGELSRFERYREDDPAARDILVCTHGGRDACCGKFGYPVYALLRYEYAAEYPGLRVWRTSHIGGHRFAPTLIDFPDGRYWGHMKPEALESLVLRNGPVSDLRRFYRGWAGLNSPFEQLVEREIFAEEGWEWTSYVKDSRMLESHEEGARVRIEYASPENGVQGAYEATVEVAGSVMTLGSCGPDPLQEVRQYRVTSLKNSPAKEAHAHHTDSG